MKFSKYVTSKREERNLTVRQLALYSDVSPGYISQIENGKRGTPSPDILKKLAKGLKLPYEDLMKVAGYLDVESGKKIPDQDSAHPELADKDEKDIAKRIEQFKSEIESSDGLAFDGEPMSEEAKESLVESMEHIYRTTQRINKKYIPIKYRKDDSK